MIMEEGLSEAGAIASAVAAEIYGARILRRSIEDDRRNFTRFFLLRTLDYTRKYPSKVPPNAQWKTSRGEHQRGFPRYRQMRNGKPRWCSPRATSPALCSVASVLSHSGI